MSMLGISDSHSTQQNGTKAIGARINERSLRQRDKSINYALDPDDSALRSVKRRSISRPSKYTPSAQQSNGTSDLRSIEKIYMRKSLGRLKNTDLETIFEDVTDDAAEGDSNKINKHSATAFGLRKLKRRLTFSTTKALKDKRKKRALSILGRCKKGKKVSMQFFLDHLNALNGVHDNDNDKDETISVENATANVEASNHDQ